MVLSGSYQIFPVILNAHKNPATVSSFFIRKPPRTAMKLLAFNGSPRKKWNTAQLLEHALEGAESEGAKTKLYHLYELDFTGCTSCFACKRAGGKSYGHCAVKDDLQPILEKIGKADAILIGSPIYLGITTGITRCFLERLVYPYLVYDMERSSLFRKKIRTAFIYTAGATDEMLQEMGIERNVKGT
jgi:multimeric flavodoxin WrbA